MSKKCVSCGELNPLTNFYKQAGNKDNLATECKTCWIKRVGRNRKKDFNTGIGFLKMRYNAIKDRYSVTKEIKHKCHFTFKEFCEAFEKHKQKYGMNSAWGPHHLPIIMIYQGRKGHKGNRHINSNLSCDRLDSSRPYTLQNLIFIRTDENNRKKDSSYEDCIAQIKLHEERFINMKAI